MAYRSADPTRTYYAYNAAWAFFFALAFTLSAVYYVRDAGLNPLQLVLVGTTLELACFLFAFAGHLWLTLAALWLRQIADTVTSPIHSGWLNRHVDSSSRATVLSIVSQANAIGQVAGGPPLGALGRRSLRGALLASGLIWLPIPALYLHLKEPAEVSGKKPAPDAV